MSRAFHPAMLGQRASEARELDVQEQRTRAAMPGIVALGFCAGLLTTALLVGRRYIDPGSGSFAIQIIIAAVLGGVLTARLWLRHLFWRVLGLVRRKKTEEQPAGEEVDG